MMFFGYDDNARYKLILERRKEVVPGDSPLREGDVFTHSFNLATGDRSYMSVIWKAKSITAQQVYAETVLNTDGPEKPNAMFKYEGRTHMFDRSEYQFYEARGLHDLIVAEREASEQRGANVLTLVAPSSEPAAWPPTSTSS